MKINRDVLPSKWLVAAILVSSAQFTIAPRHAQAKCGDYVMLGRHATNPPQMAADHVGYGHVGYGTMVNDTAGREHLAAQILIHAALTHPVATHPVATHPGATHNRPLQGGQCSGPMCSNNDPRPLGAPPAPGETEVRWGLIAVEWLRAIVVTQFVRFADEVTPARIVAGSIYRPPR